MADHATYSRQPPYEQGDEAPRRTGRLTWDSI